ncbi:MAG: SEC-C domain-containing protein [Alphaproteobacteria bacterium]|nr:SEC-C domain-containing protein [Alphaproteobacteria bacterium]
METANHKTHAGKLGRNEPCSCGSGKKYKTCCYASKANHQNVDPDWRKIRQTEGELIDKHLTPYVRRKYEQEFFHLALDNFYMGIELSKDLEDGFFREVFIPWCLFNWVPNVEGLPEQPIAMTYLIEHRSRLTTYERGFIEAMCNSYFSFYQVMGVEYEKSVSLRDIILGSEHKIKEISGTHCFKEGHILYARILSYGNQEVAIGVAPTMLPTHGHAAVIDWMTDFQKQHPKVPFTPAILVAEEEGLRAICMTSMEAQFKPRRIA